MKTEKSIDIPKNKAGQVQVKKTEKSQEGFIFYESFEYAIRDTLSIKNQLIAYKAIVEYGLNFRIPENLPKPVMSILLMAKPQIDRNFKKKQDGMKGKENGIEGAGYGVFNNKKKKMEIPVKEKTIQQNQSPERDPFGEPEPFPEGCDF